MRYLRHQDNKEKYQYELKEIHTNNLECYSECTQNLVKDMTDTDKLLEAFYQFCLDACVITPLNYLEIVCWFRENNSLSYFVQHQKQLLDMALAIYENYRELYRSADSSSAIDNIQQKLGGIQ